MQEVIQRVIAAEAEAKQLVQAARTEAEQLLGGARVEARQLIEQAKREAQLEAERILAAAEAGARDEKKERLACAAKEIEASIRLDDATAQQAVEAAVRCVRGGFHEPSPRETLTPSPLSGRKGRQPTPVGEGEIVSAQGQHDNTRFHSIAP